MHFLKKHNKERRWMILLTAALWCGRGTDLELALLVVVIWFKCTHQPYFTLLLSQYSDGPSSQRSLTYPSEKDSCWYDNATAQTRTTVKDQGTFGSSLWQSGLLEISERGWRWENGCSADLFHWSRFLTFFPQTVHCLCGRINLLLLTGLFLSLPELVPTVGGCSSSFFF